MFKLLHDAKPFGGEGKTENQKDKFSQTVVMSQTILLQCNKPSFPESGLMHV
jgi:hypothetical protein